MVYTVAFIGLPSSGKSSLINALAGKRLLQSGVCRTTTNPKILDELLKDDDENVFQVIDLAGICDSEETDTKFTTMTLENIVNANLIFWVSDVTKAFITSHEVNEYNKIKEYLQQKTLETGKLYDIGIILTKCDINYVPNAKKDNIKLFSNGEILDDEDTNLNDIINKVKEKFPHENIRLFNAFGRALYDKKTSNIFKNFVKNLYRNESNYNIEFKISEYYKSFEERQKETYYKHFLRNYDEYLKNKVNFDFIVNSFNNLNEMYQYEICFMILNKNDLNFFDYCLLVKFITYAHLEERFKEQFNMKFLQFNIEILKKEYYNIGQNKVKTCSVIEVYNYINTLYKSISKSLQVIFFEKYIMLNSERLNDIHILNLYVRAYDIYMEHNKSSLFDFTIELLKKLSNFKTIDDTHKEYLKQVQYIEEHFIQPVEKILLECQNDIDRFSKYSRCEEIHGKNSQININQLMQPIRQKQTIICEIIEKLVTSKILSNSYDNSFNILGKFSALVFGISCHNRCSIICQSTKNNIDTIKQNINSVKTQFNEMKNHLNSAKILINNQLQQNQSIEKQHIVNYNGILCDTNALHDILKSIMKTHKREKLHNIIFSNDYKLKTDDRFKILVNYFDSTCISTSSLPATDNFKEMFNTFIQSTPDKNTFFTMSELMIKYCYHHLQIYIIDYDLEEKGKTYKEIQKNVTKFLQNFTDLFRDAHYVLLCKLIVLDQYYDINMNDDFLAKFQKFYQRPYQNSSQSRLHYIANIEFFFNLNQNSNIVNRIKDLSVYTDSILNLKKLVYSNLIFDSNNKHPHATHNFNVIILHPEELMYVL